MLMVCYLSMPSATEGLINIFEVDAETMKYDDALFQQDVANYGLFSYEEFSEIIAIPEDIFEAFGVKYLKISIGKGLINWENHCSSRSISKVFLEKT